MRIRFTILDMGDPMKPSVVWQIVTDTDSLQYPVMNFFPLPATMDARVQHPYAVVIEEDS